MAFTIGESSSLAMLKIDYENVGVKASIALCIACYAKEDDSKADSILERVRVLLAMTVQREPAYTP